MGPVAANQGAIYARCSRPTAVFFFMAPITLRPLDLTLYGVFVSLCIANLWQFVRLVRYFRDAHPTVWGQFGFKGRGWSSRPSEESQNAAAQWRLARFLWARGHLGIGDDQLNRMALTLKRLQVAGVALFFAVGFDWALIAVGSSLRSSAWGMRRHDAPHMSGVQIIRDRCARAGRTAQGRVPALDSHGRQRPESPSKPTSSNRPAPNTIFEFLASSLLTRPPHRNSGSR